MTCYFWNIGDRINGFKLYGITENGDRTLIYRDEGSFQIRNEIFLDSNDMPVVPIKEIIVEGGDEKEHILTLCEVYVFGKYLISLARTHAPNHPPTPTHIHTFKTLSKPQHPNATPTQNSFVQCQFWLNLQIYNLFKQWIVQFQKM